ncbi:MAG TPA: hypothetical protein VMU68_11215 [Acidimicrobiales bacterium]|nr:hypothetical protein [Acidimicrobiales bacterium]
MTSADLRAGGGNPNGAAALLVLGGVIAVIGAALTLVIVKGRRGK